MTRCSTDSFSQLSSLPLDLRGYHNSPEPEKLNRPPIELRGKRGGGSERNSSCTADAVASGGLERVLERLLLLLLSLDLERDLDLEEDECLLLSLEGDLDRDRLLLSSLERDQDRLALPRGELDPTLPLGDLDLDLSLAPRGDLDLDLTCTGRGDLSFFPLPVSSGDLSL